MNLAKLILLVILLSALSGCGNALKGDLEAFCVGSKQSADAHVNSMVLYGQQIIDAGGGEVLVTGDEFITTYDKACNNG